MKCLIFVTFLAVVLATNKPEVLGPEPPASSSTQVPTTTNPTTNPSSSTTPLSTTPSASTKTTTKPTTSKTTTTVPTTTTTTTTTPKTTVTTPPTTTTTTQIPTTTERPKPPPKPENPKTGLWMKNYTSENRSCVVLNAAIQIEYTYNLTINETATGWENVPFNATVIGNCTNNNNSITLVWAASNKTFNNSVTVDFSRKDKFYQINLIKVEIVNAVGKANVTKIELLRNQTDFETSVERSYKCDKEQTLNLTRNGSIHLWHTKFQAFHNVTNGQLEAEENCESVTTSDVVPLAVGCALAGLVIIVLVGYLIGRKRAQARGYLSM